jgi:uncharacterized protein (TIGR03032 family)
MSEQENIKDPKENKKLSKKELQELYKELDFNCEYTDNIPAILKQLNISLAFTSYQAGRLMLVRSDGESLDVNFKSFQRPMGLVATEKGLTLGIFTQIINFQREDGLLEKIKQPLQDIKDDVTAPRIKPKEQNEEQKELMAQAKKNQEEELAKLTPEQLQQRQKQIQQFKEQQEKLNAPVDERVDACFITRSTHYSGMINIHDIDWGDEGLWAVNSSFSCLCTVEPDYSFVPRWKPHFIDELVPEDRCHLNGMALKDGKPAYVTTFSKYNQKGMWRKGEKFDGTLMEVESNTILVDGLAMPHSPRWHDDKVFFCNSGHGLICTYQPETQEVTTIAEVPGFTRGMDFYGPIMFVGLSKVREADVTKPAPLADKYDETHSGIWLMNLEDNSEIGHIKFTGNVDQIYDIAVIPDCHFPELLEPNHPSLRNHFCHPKIKL